MLTVGDVAPDPPIAAQWFQEQHRVGVADRRGQQAFGVGGCGWHHDLQSWDIGQLTLQGVGVKLGGPDATAERRADGDGRLEASLAAVPEPGHLARHLVHGLVGETQKLDLSHRNEAGHGQTNGRPDDHPLGERSVDHPVLAELLEQAFGSPEHPAVTGHVLAQDDYPVVPCHLEV